ncbi:MAG TPA: hypothetical protein VGH65_05605 [Verrucomicrobiaceae bacterium]|jgi:hypothetical protein
MRHAWWETLLFRAGIAWCAWQTMAGPLPYASLPRPHGMAHWVDVTFAGNAETMKWVSALVGLCLTLYVCKVAVRLVLLPPLLVSIAMGALENSQGAINHTSQVVTLVLLAHWLSAVWLTIRRWFRARPPGSLTREQHAADWTRQVFISTYVVSAISKLVESRGLWLRDTPYFGLQIIKSMGMAKYGDTGAGQNVQWLAQFALDHPWVFRLFLGVALPLELFAFLALLNRRLALVFGCALLAFHVVNTEVMHLGFYYHKALLVVLFINPVWWLVQGVKRAGRVHAAA